MSITYIANTSLTTIDCGVCGGTYAIQEDYRQEKHNVGGSWHCPYCETGWGYSNNSLNEKLKRMLEAEKQTVLRERQRHDQTKASLRDTAKSLSAQKGVTTRIKNRVKAGVCPCCNRTFANLAAHMKGQHPTFAKVEDHHA